MESGLELALFLVAIILIAGPILAIVAFVRTGRMQGAADQVPKLTARLFDLERKLAALEKALQSGGAPSRPLEGPPIRRPEAVAPVAAAPPAVPDAAPVPPSKPAPTAAIPVPPISQQAAPAQPAFSASMLSESAKGSDSDVETMIAGHWFYYVGILALALATAFFLKYAFDNNWIGPTGRVAVGILAGSAMFPLSGWILGRGYKYFSEGIAGLGAAILYLSIWAGWHYYLLFGQTAAFVAMILVTAVTTAVAIGRDSQRIALLGLIGGVLTPSLVSTGQNAEAVLFTYLAVLAAAMLVIAWRRDWKVVPPLVFGSTIFYFWGWYADFYNEGELARTLFFATVFFAVFAALPAVQSLGEGALPDVLQVILVGANAFQYLIALRQMLWPTYRWGLTFAVLVLAAAHLLAERALPQKSQRSAAQTQATRLLYAGLALVFATLAIPIRLDGHWITIAWAAEALVLIWAGLRVNMLALRIPGLLMFAVVGIRLIMLEIHVEPAPAFLLNARFLTMAFCAAAAALAFVFARRSAVDIQPPESHIYFGLAIAGNVCFLVAISWEVWNLFWHMPSLGIDRELAAQLGLSMLWAVYALAQIVPGFKWKSVALRWQGLALMGATIVKVFIFDLSSLTRFYRIVSFFGLGLVLLALSFFYQKISATGRKKP